MGRHLKPKNICSIYDRLLKYQIEIEQFVNNSDLQTNSCIDNIYELIYKIKEELKCNSHIGLFFNTLFNKHGVKEKKMHVYELIDLLVDSVVFDMYIKNTTQPNKNIAIKQLLSILFRTTIDNDLSFDYLTIDYYGVLKKIQSYYNMDEDYAYEELMCGVIDCLEAISQEDEYIIKLEKIYALDEYIQSLCTLVYTKVLDYQIDNKLEIRLNYFKSDIKEVHSLSKAIKQMRETINKRRKTYNDTGEVEEFLYVMNQCLDEGLINNDSLYDILGSGLDTYFSNSEKNKMKKISLGDFFRAYEAVTEPNMPMDCLEKESAFQRSAALISIQVSRYSSDTSDEMQIYENCYHLLNYVNSIFDDMSIFDNIKLKGNFNIRNKMRQEIASVLFSRIDWDGHSMTFYDFLKDGWQEYIYYTTGCCISRFDKIDTKLFIPYLKSMVYDYNFEPSNNGENIKCIDCIIDIINKIIEHINIIVSDFYERICNNSSQSCISAIINDYLNSVPFKEAWKKLFAFFETRHSQTFISLSAMQDIVQRKKIIYVEE